MKKLNQHEFLRALQIAGLGNYQAQWREENGKHIWQASFRFVSEHWLPQRNALARISPDFELTYTTVAGGKLLTVTHPAL